MEYTLKISTYVDGKFAVAWSVVDTKMELEENVATPILNGDTDIVTDEMKIEALEVLGLTDEEIGDVDLELVALKKDGKLTKKSLEAIGWDS